MSLDSSPAEYQPCPLQYHDFKHLDHNEHCPTYTAALDHGVTVAQLDSLEKELLLMKNSIENHIHSLETEIGALSDWQVKRDYKKRKHSDTLDSTPRVAKATPSDPNPPKKQKVDTPEVPPPAPGGARKMKQAKPESAEEPPESAKTSHRPKGDAPDRFWQLVEPYCAPITDTDIKLLQGLRSSDEDSEYFLIPPLGQHYSRKWALEDLLDEHSEAARLLQGNSDSSVWGDDSEALLKQAELEAIKGSKEGKGEEYGPLTQRLIAAFIDDPTSSGKTFALPATHTTPTSISSDKLENRIKDELITLGLIDMSETRSSAGEEDEVLAELKKKQAELKAVMEYNRHQREVLCSVARQEMHTQHKMRELQGVDDEVMDWLKKYRQKKKTMGRKEREGVWKLLGKRSALCEQLQSWPRLPTQ